jgi:hypothetical protein
MGAGRRVICNVCFGWKAEIATLRLDRSFSEMCPPIIYARRLSVAVQRGNESVRAAIASVIVMVVTLAACSKAGPAQSGTDAENPFPRKGNYHVVHQVVEGNQSKSEEADSEIDVSDREKLEKELVKDAGSNCRDKQVSIGQGSFNVHMTCSTPDGDFNHISVDRQGTYSRNSIDVTTQSTLLGISSQESYSARLKGS